MAAVDTASHHPELAAHVEIGNESEMTTRCSEPVTASRVDTADGTVFIQTAVHTPPGLHERAVVCWLHKKKRTTCLVGMQPWFRAF